MIAECQSFSPTRLLALIEPHIHNICEAKFILQLAQQPEVHPHANVFDCVLLTTPLSVVTGPCRSFVDQEKPNTPHQARAHYGPYRELACLGCCCWPFAHLR